MNDLARKLSGEPNIYGTGTVKGSDIFDTSVVGYDRDGLIPGHPKNKQMEKYYNLKGEIKMVSPYEYFQGCAKIFNTTVDRLLRQTRKYGNTDYTATDPINKLKKVILQDKSKFPMTFLDFARRGQEGMHRMYAAGELFGWDKKFPCLVITWADEDRHKKDVETDRQRTIELAIDKAVEETKKFRFDDLDDAVGELEWQLELANDNLEEFNDGKIVYDVGHNEDSVYASIKDEKNVQYERTIDIDELRIETEEDDLVGECMVKNNSNTKNHRGIKKKVNKYKGFNIVESGIGDYPFNIYKDDGYGFGAHIGRGRTFASCKQDIDEGVFVDESFDTYFVESVEEDLFFNEPDNARVWSTEEFEKFLSMGKELA